MPPRPPHLDRRSGVIARGFKADHVTCVEANPRLCDEIGHVHAENGGISAPVRTVAAVRLSDLVAEARPTGIICDIEGGAYGLVEACEFAGVRHIALQLPTRICGGAGMRKVFDDLHRHDFPYHQNVSRGDIVLFERPQAPA